VVGCCECGDEYSGSCATELVIMVFAKQGKVYMILALVSYNGLKTIC
jgi:hypothetical protein